MSIDESLVSALEDLDLDSLTADEEDSDDALSAGYGMVEGGASLIIPCTCSCCFC